jgi:hypothetical protein
VKKKYIIVLIVVLFIVGGFGMFLMKSQPKQSASSEMTPASGQTQQSTQNSFSSIKEALSKSLSLSCSFTDENGRKTQVYIKNGAVRSDITTGDPKESGSSIIKDKKIYFWNDSMAMVMTMPEITPGPVRPGKEDTMNHQQSGNPQDMLNAIEKYKDSCKPAVVADSLFTPPSDRKFVDYSSMMPPQGMNGKMQPPANGQNDERMMQQPPQR